MWCNFSSVGEVYAAQQSPAGRFLLGVGHALQELRMRELPGRLRLRGLHTRELRLRGIDHSYHDSAAVLSISVKKREVTEATSRILTTKKRRLLSHYRGPRGAGRPFPVGLIIYIHVC